MLAEPWMKYDERTPEEKRRQRMSNLEQQEASLVRQLEIVRRDMRKLLTEIARQ